MSFRILGSSYPTFPLHKPKREPRPEQHLDNVTRATRAYSEQWKRYRNSKKIINLRLGNTESIGLFPNGYDPFFMHSRPSNHLPIKGSKPDLLANHPDVNKIILADTDIHKGVFISLWSYNPALIERFKYLCSANIPKELNWFHQANSREYQMFEFWLPQSEAMLEIARRIAKALGLKLIVNLSKVYRPSVVVKQKFFEPFDSDMHMFGKFNGR